MRVGVTNKGGFGRMGTLVLKRCFLVLLPHRVVLSGCSSWPFGPRGAAETWAQIRSWSWFRFQSTLMIELGGPKLGIFFPESTNRSSGLIEVGLVESAGKIHISSRKCQMTDCPNESWKQREVVALGMSTTSKYRKYTLKKEERLAKADKTAVLLCGVFLPWNRAGSGFQCFVLNIAGYGWILRAPTDVWRYVRHTYPSYMYSHREAWLGPCKDDTPLWMAEARLKID